MKDMRNLLIDCRIELRKSLREFHKTELCARLDQAIQRVTALAEAAATAKAAEGGATVMASVATPADESQGAKPSTTHQVAMAWQMIARDFKFSDPPLYEKMRQKVLERIQAKTVVDESTELRELQGTFEKLQATLAQQQRQQAALALECDTLLGTLASAVPELSDGGDRLSVAMARIEWLKTQKAKSVTAPVSNSRRANDEVAATDSESHVPGGAVIDAVAAGARKFTDRQREWSVGEAMVLSGFKLTPVELLELGDAHIAGIIVNARTG